MWNSSKIIEIIRKIDWHIVYRLFSGILFIIIGSIFLLQSKNFKSFSKPGIISLVICAYGVYRIVMFIKLCKK
ncbi:MAG: hypothetical protein WC614_05795 [bacterium]